MRLASLTRHIVLLSAFLVMPMVSYSADFKELWEEKGGTVKEPVKTSNDILQGAKPKAPKQNDKGDSPISHHPEQTDPQAPAKLSTPTPAPADVATRERIKRVQMLLFQLGYTPGLIDGILGAKTRTAIKNFQEHIGMPSTGEIDDRLIAELELAVDQKRVSERIEPRREWATPERDKRIYHQSDVLPKMPDPLVSRELRAQEVYRKVKDSVVFLVAGRSSREISQGSAVAVSPRHILTNFHVVKNQPFIFVKLGDQIVEARLAKRDEKLDICILVLEESNLTPIEGARRFRELEVGEKVYSVGAPSGLESTLAEGIISGKRVDGRRKLIQTSAPISPGSSGGGLFDSYGNLIGITTFMVREAQNLNFAISVEDYWE